jgi:uncharacterized protein YbcV (DUF1398 family)
MFTLQQLKAAHAKVKSGADFPRYIREIKALGLKSYTYSVTDGTITYFGEDGHQVVAPAIYQPKTINPVGSSGQLQQAIIIHQQGQTDFLTFCQQAADAGVKQWVIDTENMLCTYEDTSGRQLVVEPIPDADY